jgi:hypothetical protein
LDLNDTDLNEENNKTKERERESARKGGGYPTMFAEPSVVPGTVPYLEGLCVDVKVLTVLVGALAEPLKEVADGHLGHFILVEEFTVVSLLAEVAHPVFADHRPLSSHVAERTVAPSRTHSV